MRIVGALLLLTIVACVGLVAAYEGGALTPAAAEFDARLEAAAAALRGGQRFMQVPTTTTTTTHIPGASPTPIPGGVKHVVKTTTTTVTKKRQGSGSDSSEESKEAIKEEVAKEQAEEKKEDKEKEVKKEVLKEEEKEAKDKKNLEKEIAKDEANGKAAAAKAETAAEKDEVSKKENAEEINASKKAAEEKQEAKAEEKAKEAEISKEEDQEKAEARADAKEEVAAAAKEKAADEAKESSGSSSSSSSGSSSGSSSSGGCKKKKKGSSSSSSGGDDTIDLSLEIAGDDEGCGGDEESDPVLEAKKAQLAATTKDLDEKLASAEKEESWYSKATALVKSLTVKTTNVAKHMKDMRNQIKKLEFHKNLLAKEVAKEEQARGAQVGIKKLEAALEKLMKNAGGIKGEMAKLADRKSVFLKKINEVKSALSKMKKQHAQLTGGSDDEEGDENGNDERNTYKVVNGACPCHLAASKRPGHCNNMCP